MKLIKLFEMDFNLFPAGSVVFKKTELDIKDIQVNTNLKVEKNEKSD
ncbi:hypothetical protein [uncultured Marixanthomonas sp.]|tara:strand:+ start:88368 stop:88508 length:141 start_codon:yes stop_codon:yes gene_type:complete